ncbi:MAG: DMT family transporter [Pseudomonadota bacterium]
MTTAASATADRVARGIGLYVLAILLLASMDAVIKWLSSDYSTQQIVFFRAVFGLIPLMTILAVRRAFRDLRTRRLGGQIGRGLLSACAAICFFYAFGQMPLADAYAIAFASPLFVTALSVPILGERVGVHRWGAVAVGFIGILVVLRPGQTGLDQFLTLGALAALMGTFFFSLSVVLIRRMTRTETNAALVFYAALVTIVVSGAALPFGFAWPNAVDFGLLALVGFLGGMGMILVTDAFRSAPVAVLAPFEYTAMIWAVVYGYSIWGDLPDGWVLGGAAILVGSGLYILHRETRRHTDRVGAERLAMAPVSQTGEKDED